MEALVLFAVNAVLVVWLLVLAGAGVAVLGVMLSEAIRAFLQSRRDA